MCDSDQRWDSCSVEPSVTQTCKMGLLLCGAHRLVPPPHLWLCHLVWHHVCIQADCSIPAKRQQISIETEAETETLGIHKQTEQRHLSAPPPLFFALFGPSPKNEDFTINSFIHSFIHSFIKWMILWKGNGKAFSLFVRINFPIVPSRPPALCAVCSVQCAVCSVQCAVCSAASEGQMRRWHWGSDETLSTSEPQCVRRDWDHPHESVSAVQTAKHLSSGCSGIVTGFQPCSHSANMITIDRLLIEGWWPWGLIVGRRPLWGAARWGERPCAVHYTVHYVISVQSSSKMRTCATACVYVHVPLRVCTCATACVCTCIHSITGHVFEHTEVFLLLMYTHVHALDLAAVWDADDEAKTGPVYPVLLKGILTLKQLNRPQRNVRSVCHFPSLATTNL